MKLIITPQAENDLADISDHLEQRDGPIQAENFLDELYEKFQAIAASPLIYQVREELGGNTRARTYKRYVIYFREDGTSVTIGRVLHGDRDVRAWDVDEGFAE